MTNGDDDFRPARGYSWPPFEEGNTAALTHGARSERMVRPIAEAVKVGFVEDAPWCASPAFSRTVESWAWAEAQAVLLRRFLDEHGMFDGDGEERTAVRTLDRVENRLVKLRDQLGLTPQSLGKLLASAASVAKATEDEQALAALQAEGAAIMAARVTPGTGDDGEAT